MSGPVRTGVDAGSPGDPNDERTSLRRAAWVALRPGELLSTFAAVAWVLGRPASARRHDPEVAAFRREARGAAASAAARAADSSTRVERAARARFGRAVGVAAGGSSVAV